MLRAHPRPAPIQKLYQTAYSDQYAPCLHPHNSSLVACASQGQDERMSGLSRRRDKSRRQRQSAQK